MESIHSPLRRLPVRPRGRSMHSTVVLELEPPLRRSTAAAQRRAIENLSSGNGTDLFLLGSHAPDRPVRKLCVGIAGSALAAIDLCVIDLSVLHLQRVSGVPEKQVIDAVQRLRAESAGLRKHDLAYEVLAAEHLVHETPHEVHVLVADLDEA